MAKRKIEKKRKLRGPVQGKLGELLHLTIKDINIFSTLPLHNVKIN